MPIEVKKRDGENTNALLYRFNRKIKESGIMKTLKKKRFRSRTNNRSKRRAAALYRASKEKEIVRQKKWG